jgi:putative ABC transport system permease protein
MDPEHKLANVSVKLARKRDTAVVSATMIGRAKQAHHGIEDIKIVDLESESIRAWQRFMDEMRGWRVVLTSLAATVLLVGGVGVLSVMLISFSDRRYEIGLRKAMGASDGEILVQFLLEACVLAAVGASIGTFLGTVACKALSASFPYGLVVNPMGLIVAWITCLVLAIVFGMYPAVRASRLSPMEAMR